MTMRFGDKLPSIAFGLAPWTIYFPPCLSMNAGTFAMYFSFSQTSSSEKGGGGSLPEWLLHLDGRDYSSFPLPIYSAPYWAIGGFVIGALWVALRRRD